MLDRPLGFHVLCARIRGRQYVFVVYRVRDCLNNIGQQPDDVFRHVLLMCSDCRIGRHLPRLCTAAIKSSSVPGVSYTACGALARIATGKGSCRISNANHVFVSDT